MIGIEELDWNCTAGNAPFCSPIGGWSFREKTQLNIVTDRMLHSVYGLITACMVSYRVSQLLRDLRWVDL